MHFQVRVYFCVSVHRIVDETFILVPAPGHAWTGILTEAGVLASRDEPLRPIAIALPMEAAAGIHEAFHFQVTAVQEEPDKRVVVVQLGISGDDDAGMDLFFKGLTGHVAQAKAGYEIHKACKSDPRHR